jgi:hypothetical protein
MVAANMSPPTSRQENPMKINIRDFDATIIKMWSEGSTGLMISAEIGFTRSSVMSRISKLRAKKIINGPILDARMDAIRALVAKENSENKTTSRFNPNPIALRAAFDSLNPSKGGHVGYDGLTSKSCRYVINEGSAAEYLFCGATKEKGSYCQHHHNLCYVPNSTLRAKSYRDTKW